YKSIVGCWRIATSADLAAATITMTSPAADGGISAALIALTGDLRFLPAGWGYLNSWSQAPCYQDNAKDLFAEAPATTIHLSYQQRANSLAVYVGVLSQT